MKSKKYTSNNIFTSYSLEEDIFLTRKTYEWTPKWNIPSSVFINITDSLTPRADIILQKTSLKGCFLEGAITFKDKITGQVKISWNNSQRIIDTNNKKSYDGDLTNSNYYKDYINNISINGGDVILSLSGPDSQEIEALMPNDAEQVTEVYLGIINNYKLKYINFNFQRDFLCNDLAVRCHIKAIAGLIKELPELRIAYSALIELKGFQNYTEHFINLLYDNHIRPSLINALAMEFDLPHFVEINKRIQNAIGVALQIKNIYSDLTPEQIYNMIGICSLFDQHFNLERFTIYDQYEVNKYAKIKKVASLTGCYIENFTKNPDAFYEIIATHNQDEEVSLSGI